MGNTGGGFGGGFGCGPLAAGRGRGAPAARRPHPLAALPRGGARRGRRPCADRPASADPAGGAGFGRGAKYDSDVIYALATDRIRFPASSTVTHKYQEELT